MNGPRVFSIASGIPFLPTLADALVEGRLVPDFRPGGDPLALADVSIFVPTRRAARELRSVFAERLGGSSAILPVIRPLGEFDEDAAAFFGDAEELALAPPIPAIERILLLAPLVQAWKRRLPGHVAAKFAEEVVVPASTADAIWLARDLAALIDDVETEGADWTKLVDLAGSDLSGWWQVTLNFLDIVTAHWPDALAARDRSNPAAHRNALIRAETERLKRNPPAGPVIAAGSTGSIPAVAGLLAAIARLERGAVVLPGFDSGLDARSWTLLAGTEPSAQLQGHPQFGVGRLVRRLGVERADVVPLGTPEPALETRRQIIAEAMRPAATSDQWLERRTKLAVTAMHAALSGLTLVEAANEREEAVTAALALRHAVATEGRRVALVTPDRELARRVSAELLRFGILADDSGGVPLLRTPPAQLLSLLVEVIARPGNPVSIAALLKHPLLRLGLGRKAVRRAVEAIDLVALRGSPARPDIVGLATLFDERLTRLKTASRRPFWLARLDDDTVGLCRDVLRRLAAALQPIALLREAQETTLASALAATVTALEAMGRAEDQSLSELYGHDAGEKLADVLRGLLATTQDSTFARSEWPDVLNALLAPEVVKPSAGGDGRVSVWGTLEARLQHVDTLVICGMNEGSWPGRADPDRFLSRMMKSGLDLQPPERRIGLAAHDFMMAMGNQEVILTRAARSGDAPATPSRWLQRLTTFVGKEHTDAMRRRGATLVGWARSLDRSVRTSPFTRPAPTPPSVARPKRFSVTEIETLRRDPYAIYAKRILQLQPLDRLVRDPGAAERGTLFHEILSRFTKGGIDPREPDAETGLLAIGRECFADLSLPADVVAVWWPRFVALATGPDGFLHWDRRRSEDVAHRFAEIRAEPTEVGKTGISLYGYADRVDVLAGGMADILDYKTGSSPSKVQAHTLLAPQLALEGALLLRGAFVEVGPREPSVLAHVRLKADGLVEEETILKYQNQIKSARMLADDAWRRLDDLLTAYNDPGRAYVSRALPFREGDTDGDYDHLARVLEWSAGGEQGDALE